MVTDTDDIVHILTNESQQAHDMCRCRAVGAGDPQPQIPPLAIPGGWTTWLGRRTPGSMVAMARPAARRVWRWIWTPAAELPANRLWWIDRGVFLGVLLLIVAIGIVVRYHDLTAVGIGLGVALFGLFWVWVARELRSGSR